MSILPLPAPDSGNPNVPPPGFTPVKLLPPVVSDNPVFHKQCRVYDFARLMFVICRRRLNGNATGADELQRAIQRALKIEITMAGVTL